MTWRLATLRELAESLRTALAAVTVADSAAFAAVRAWAGPRERDLAAQLEQVTRTPAALIVPGPATLPAAGARAKRVVRFHVYVVGAFAAAPEIADSGAWDLVDAVVRAFQPTADAKAAQRVVDGVIWEPAGHQVVDLLPNHPVIRIDLDAIDFMQSRTA